MASVQKRTRNGQTRWVARWRDGDGNDRSRTFDRRADAVSAAHRAEAEDRHRPDIDLLRRELTVGDWLDRWLDEHVAPRCAAGQLAPRTATGYESNVRIHLAAQLGPVRLADLRVSDVDQLLTRMLATGYSPGTARSVRATLSAALSTAGRADLVDRNAAQLAAPPHLPTPDPSSFDAGEVDRIFIAAGRHRLGSAIAVAVLANLRSSEIAGLAWGDVDLDAGTFAIVRTTHRIPASAARVVPTTGLIDSAPKTTGSGRTTPLPVLAVQILREHRTVQTTERLAAPVWTPSDRVWTSSVGTRLDGDALRKAHYEILDAAGVPARTGDGEARGLHELRRTWAERMRRAGVPVEDAARLGRWTTPATMMRHYSATPQDRLHAAAQAVAGDLTWG